MKWYTRWFDMTEQCELHRWRRGGSNTGIIAWMHDKWDSSWSQFLNRCGFKKCVELQSGIVHFHRCFTLKVFQPIIILLCTTSIIFTNWLQEIHAILFLFNPNIFDIKIYPITICDHAPVSLTLKIESSFTPFPWWHFNTSLLKDSHSHSFIREGWPSFLEMNNSPNTSPALLRETGKVVTRRKIISNSSHKKKTRAKSTKQLMKEKLKELTMQTAPKKRHGMKYKPSNFNWIRSLQKKTEFLLQQLRYKNFEQNKKSEILFSKSTSA